MFSKQSLGQRNEGFACFGQDESLRGFGPFELEAGRQRRDPYLPDWRVRRDHELAGTILEKDVHDTVVVFELESRGFVLRDNQRVLQGFEGAIGLAAELGFVKDIRSLPVNRSDEIDSTVDKSYQRSLGKRQPFAYTLLSQGTKIVYRVPQRRHECATNLGCS